MCGISGFWQGVGIAAEQMRARIAAMTDTLAHRGPDDRGVWVEVESGVALGNRRLSILDLSPAGHQPMISACGRYVIAYNGEVYNFAEIKTDLPRLRSSSDTEVILEACARWGVAGALSRLNGMFAFALWDRKERNLTLSRDRIGVKPLYYGRCGTTLMFASELKALCAHPDFVRDVNRDSLALFFRYGYIPYPHSIYQGIYQLPPGHILTLAGPAFDFKPVPYWSAKEIVERGITHPFRGSEDEAVSQLDSLLRSAVAMRMISDVPLGVFLSGGIDSSTVAALMQAQSPRPVKTFAIGFREGQYNEAPCAREVAGHLGTEHTELYATAAEVQQVIPTLAEVYDEPFADSSQLPTLLISKLTRRYVTVSLSGDGGDELFGGYNRYLIGERLWQRIGKLPISLRRLVAQGIYAVSPGNWDLLSAVLSPFLPRRWQMRLPGEKLYKLAAVLDATSVKALYQRLVSHWTLHELVLGAHEPMSDWTSPLDATSDMMYRDLITYLPGDILTKVDRATMSTGLEGRMPFLDYRVVEFAWQLPLSFKVKNGRGKYLLRRLLYRYVPVPLLSSPKMGFAVPIGAWLRGELRPWAESLLSPDLLQRDGFLRPQPVLLKWREHLTGRRDWQYLLWDVLMFQLWRQKWLR